MLRLLKYCPWSVYYYCIKRNGVLSGIRCVCHQALAFQTHLIDIHLTANEMKSRKLLSFTGDKTNYA